MKHSNDCVMSIFYLIDGFRIAVTFNICLRYAFYVTHKKGNTRGTQERNGISVDMPINSEF